MGNIYYLSERNHIVEEYLHCVDAVIRQNLSLIKAAHLDCDDLYQMLSIRLIRCVNGYDPAKGDLEKHIYAQLRYELLNQWKIRRLIGITGSLKDFRRGNIVSLNVISENSELRSDKLAA